MTISSGVDRLARLQAAIGDDRVRTDADLTAGFLRDSADIADPGVPLAVVSPRTTEEVQEVLRWATAHGVAVVPRGAGTGISGGVLAVDGGIVLSTDKLTAVRELSVEDRLAVVEPGVLNAELNALVRPHGLMFAADPSSWETCSVGGNVATNAGGLRCVRYGTTRANVLGLEVVLADGALLRTGGRTVKRSAGYDLTQLMIGSEGTLGVVTAVTAKLTPLPPPQVTCLATFVSAAGAARAAATVMRELRPTIVELMDAASLRAVDAYRGTGFDAAVGAVLLVQVDATAGAEAGLEDLLTREGADDVATAADATQAEELLDIRRSAYPALQALGTTLVEDVAVPVSKLAELLARIEEISAETGAHVITVAHAGDGNAHPILLLGEDAAGRKATWDAADAIFRSAQRLGGTVSGEHGVGRLKKPWLVDELGPSGLAVHRAIKASLDPQWLLNPGAVFDRG
ncbi:MAG TPA: FAD-linked oxidase C-terminal domain-containing protein [Mycobacteriales bacterium]|nr:FAD-linked oxidase C-terminal domain-containing protein [Mycobacteriales bacterium]